MTRVPRFVLPLVFIIFVGFIIYSTMNMNQYSVTVCVELDGRSACRSASGATKEDALRVAQDNACAQIASGMGNIRRCGQKPPVSVEWQE